MTVLIIFLCLILVGIVVVQIGKVTELSNSIRGEEETQRSSDYWNSRLLLIFGAIFLWATMWSAWKYKNYMLGYGPHESASEHGLDIDNMFNTNVWISGIVFFVTHILLFWYAYKYRNRKSRKKSLFMVHDSRLEIIWSAIPAIVMTLLLFQGLNVWNKVMVEVGEDEEVINIEATGFQFGWIIRYPGEDGKLGERNFKRINGVNPLGQIWEDPKNQDDYHVDEIVLPKGKKVRVRITSRDVLHNFNLVHFRLKIDAVPGMPTHFIFTPNKTTEEYRQMLKAYPEYQEPYDLEDPNGPKKWEAFEYELSCAELCGKGHFSMRKIVRIVDDAEYESWLKEQRSYYINTIRNTKEDPFKGELLEYEITARSDQFDVDFKKVIETDSDIDKVIKLQYVYFETGSSVLKGMSKYQLGDVADALVFEDKLRFELSGHTDNTGDVVTNMALSRDRANAVRDYLIEQGVKPEQITAKGYGNTQPTDSNETEEGRAGNRRTELKLL